MAVKKDNRNLKYDMNYVNGFLDSHIKVERGFLEHILDVLENRKNGEYKVQLINQLKSLIIKNIHKIQSKPEHCSINTPLI